MGLCHRDASLQAEEYFEVRLEPVDSHRKFRGFAP